MIEKIEEVKRILVRASLIDGFAQYITPDTINNIAQQICQLYEADMKHLLHLIDDVFELEEKVKSKDAECQERVDKLIASYTEYIEARKSDLTGMPSRSIPHSMALQVRRDTLDFALKAFIELANK